MLNSRAPLPVGLRRDVGLVGLISLAVLVLLQFLFPLVLAVLALVGAAHLDQPLYGLSLPVFLGVYAAVYAVGIGLPAPLLTAVFRRRIRPFASTAVTPLSVVSVVLIVAAGMAACVLANFATSYITYFLSQFGIAPPTLDTFLQPTPLSLLLNTVVFAVLPAVLEEMVYRGYMLALLRPYGDLPAVVISAVLFGLMHGNLQQFPFAVLLGLAFGYVVVRTGRVWIAVILHFLNNALSSVLEYAGLFCTQQQSSKLVMVTFCAVGIVGLAAVIVLFARNEPITRIPPRRSTRFAWGALVRSVPLVLAVVVSVLLIVSTTSWGGAAV